MLTVEHKEKPFARYVQKTRGNPQNLALSICFSCIRNQEDLEGKRGNCAKIVYPSIVTEKNA